MATTISEFHGAAPGSLVSMNNATKKWCPFIDQKCIKKQGACSLQSASGEPVIICPNRLYADHFGTLASIAVECFGAAAEIVTPAEAHTRWVGKALTGNEVIVYGKWWGGEIGISAPSSDDTVSGTFKIDFVLSFVDDNLDPKSMVAVEVQTIDTTNTYRDAGAYYYSAKPGQNLDPSLEATTAGFNWENVNKRILPQIIYKGHALRREKLAQHGLYFVLPDQVYQKILGRVGGRLLEYPKGPGTVTFKTYALGALASDGRRPLNIVQSMTTTVEQIAFAFVSPQNLPEIGVYEKALNARAEELRKKR
jgi:hypothetical protein